MDLWSKITGFVSLELTAAEPMEILGRGVRKGACVWDLHPISELTVSFKAARRDYPLLTRLAEKNGGKLKLRGLGGTIVRAEQFLKRPVLALTLGLLVLVSVLLPGRILFIEVQGCREISPRLVLETAESFGLAFGTERRSIRSEYIKNELLSAIPELAWVGVNTAGSTAVITVREREPSGQEEEAAPCDVAAVCDAIVEDITLTRGTLLCAPGDVVRTGQVLVSGQVDLGITARAVPAAAEIYGRTKHSLTAKIPAETMFRQGKGKTKAYYSLVIGKKRINLYSDGGILPPTCGKMRQVIPLRLPGGKTLPVWLVIEKGELCDSVPGERPGMEELLSSFAREYVREKMVAGSVLTEKTIFSQEGELSASFECRQMIAVRRGGVILEGDTKDDPENSERGAG